MRCPRSPPFTGSSVLLMDQQAAECWLVIVWVVSETGHVLGTTLGDLTLAGMLAGRFLLGAPYLRWTVKGFTSVLWTHRLYPQCRCSRILAQVDPVQGPDAILEPPPSPNPPTSACNKRRSACLAAKPAMDSIQKAQTHLMRRMGILQPKETPLERASRKYLDVFKEPLTEAAMDAIISLTGLSI
ncbi:hypothetical protein ABZP36_002860 [Zizania latifolia]